MNAPNSGSDAGQQERRLTVARVHSTAEVDEVMFFESPRIYRLPRTVPDHDRALEQLRASAGSGTPLRVRFREPNSDIIVSVHLA